MSSIRDFIPLQKLGEGAFSTVYKVRRLTDQQIYALKKVKLTNLSQKEKKNALNEIRILASFQCNNIIAYKEAFFDDKLAVLCIVMEFAQEGDVYNYINQTKQKSGRVTEIMIWKFAADVIVALDHLHTKGILHRDLKSANIFIQGDEFKLADLNVSKVNGGRLAYTQTGTPYYASPEVWRDEPYDHKSDIWSFGCILYELACLKPPFQGKDMDQLYQNVQKSTPLAIPDIFSVELNELIESCLQKNAKKRPSAADLLCHNIISKFKNRKSVKNNEQDIEQELLRTIKLPSDLRSLKLNLPRSKYEQDFERKKVSKPSLDLGLQFQKQGNIRNDIKNFVSDRPGYPNHYVRNGQAEVNIMRNQSQVVQYKNLRPDEVHSPKNINQSEIFLSPKNRRIFNNDNIHKSPEDIITRKIASAHTNSEKVCKGVDFSDRKTVCFEPNVNYSERRPGSQKKLIIQKYDKFIAKQLQKKSNVLPRTEKRIISQNLEPYAKKEIESTDLVNGANRKDIEQWKKKLIKKSRVFSNNLFNYGMRQIK